MCSGTNRSDSMRRLVVGLGLAAALVLATGAAFAAAPQRICSVSLAGDELLALLVPASRVICVTPYADDHAMSNVAGHYPASAHRVTARLEPVLDLAPDLVLAAPWNNGDFLRVIRETGVPVHVLASIADFDEMRREISALGSLLGVEAEAARVVAALDRDLAAVREALPRDHKPPRVLSFSHLVVAGEGTTVDALIRAAGGVNAARELGVKGHEKLSAEAIVALDPDVLLLGFEDGTTVASVLAAYPQLGLLRAAREMRAIVMPPRALTTVTPFLAASARTLAAELHPASRADGADAPRQP